MRAFRFLFGFLPSVFLISSVVSAQGPPQRDPEAVAAIEASLAAMGGQPAIVAVQDSVTQGTIDPAGGDGAGQKTFVWKVRGDEFRHILQDGTETRIWVSGHGQPARVHRGKTRRLFWHTSLANPPLHQPGLVLLSQLTNPNYALIAAGTGTLAGRAVVRVRTHLDTNAVASAVTAQEWFFDQITGLPLRVEYRSPANSNAEVFFSGAAEFSDYQNVSGVLVPFRIATYRDGDALSVVNVNTIAFNVGLSPGEFDPPEEGGGQ